MNNNREMADPFMNIGNSKKNVSLKDSKYRDSVDKILKNWTPVFNDLICRFARCQSIYYGSASLVKHLNTKVQMFNPILKEVVSELLSYLKSNPRSITVDIPNFTTHKDVINDIIGSIMINGDVYNKMINGFKDYLIYGISLIKMNSSNENVINVENVDISTCVWDTECDYRDFKPSFFIREYIMNNFDVSNIYGEKFIEIRKNTSEIFNRINKSSKTILDNVKNIVLSNKKIKVDYSDDIFTKQGSVTSKEVVDNGVSQIIEYYCLINSKPDSDGKSEKHYKKYIYVNGRLASDNTLQLDLFPYIAMANYRHDAPFIAEMFDSKVSDCASEVIQLNIIENSHCDAILSSSNGTMLLDKNVLANKQATLQSIKSNVVLVDPINGQSASNAVVNLPPARIDQSTIVQAQEIKNSIRKKFGLLTFDPNQATAKSGYHEALRLDRESQSINNIITPLDAALNILGKRLVPFIQEYSTKGLPTLERLTKKEGASETLKSLSQVADYININVSESRESANNSMKIYNQLQSLSDLMGVPLQLPPEVLADALNLSEDVVEIFNKYNTPKDNELEKAEIQDKQASAADKMASAQKKIAEANNIK